MNILRVRKRAKVKTNSKVTLSCAVYLPNEMYGKKVYVINAKQYRQMVVKCTQLNRKIKKAVNLLFKG